MFSGCSARHGADFGPLVDAGVWGRIGPSAALPEVLVGIERLSTIGLLGRRALGARSCAIALERGRMGFKVVPARLYLRHPSLIGRFFGNMKPIPRLAFGNSVPLDSESDLADRLAQHASDRSIKLPDAPRDFRGHMALRQLGDLHLGAFAHTPVTVEAGDAPGHAVMIPCFGSLTFTTRRSRFTARAGHSLALLSGMGNRVETTLDSHVVTSFDKERLLRAGRSMLGLEEGAHLEINLDQSREASIRPAGHAMDGVFGNIFQIMDQLPAANLALLGLDELFYRSLAVVLSPQVALAFVNPEADRRAPPSRPEINAVCDYILGHLEQTITLTELELVSGLSARSLQLAFQKQFRCSPMQWLRRARLDWARRRLMSAGPGDSVTKIALDCGFTQMGQFSSAYRAQFGEAPSATRRRALARY